MIAAGRSSPKAQARRLHAWDRQIAVPASNAGSMPKEGGGYLVQESPEGASIWPAVKSCVGFDALTVPFTPALTVT